MNPTFMLGGELEVRRLGFGAMRIVNDREEGVRVLRRSIPGTSSVAHLEDNMRAVAD